MKKNIVPQNYFKIIWYIYQLKNALNILVALRIESWTSNGISGKNIKNITKSDSNFATTFVDHHFY